MTKAKKPMIRIHDIELDEVIDREMTDDEFAQHEADKAANAALKVETDAKVAEKQAILERLGLTADELKTILG